MSDDAEPTPVARYLIERIAREGPVSVHDYMDACLNHPEHGYYRTRRAIGAKEDFITAPEISQVFGELLGVWAAVVWQQMGSPERVRLIELGPGRGTLMSDALRAARTLPAFRAALDVVLVEPNGALQAVQRKTLDGVDVPIRWCAGLAEVADEADGTATILLANEVLDVIPVTQLIFRDEGWVERAVCVVRTDRFAYTDRGDPVEPPPRTPSPRIGSIIERRNLQPLMGDLRRLADAGPFVGLFVDYGYEGPALGTTLQAIRNQQYHHVFAYPGETDLTAHVDFAAFADDARAAGLTVDGPREQAAFLSLLGIEQRTSRLMAANPDKAGSLETATARLISPTGMGTLFKAIGVRGAAMAPLPGLLSRPIA